MAKQQGEKKAPARKTPVKKQAPGRKGATRKPETPLRKAAVKKPAEKKVAVKRSPAKKTAVKKAVAKKTPAGKKAVMKIAVKKPARPVGGRTVKKTAPKKVAVKKPAPRKAAVKRTAMKPGMAPSRQLAEAPSRAPALPAWPDALDAGQDVHVHVGIDQRGPDPRAQLHTVQGSPNELHPGTTRKTGKSHDRPGSQLERKRHQYPSSNVPNRGSAHTTKVKGRRRNDTPSGE